ncbi:MAG: hypothetical protein ACOYY3_01410 [Chloroflexota bacterium]
MPAAFTLIPENAKRNDLMNTNLINPNAGIRVSSSPGQKTGILDVLAFLVGLFSAYYLSVIGQVYLAELILPFTIPLVWRYKKYLLLTKETKWLVFSGGLWLFAQIVTDLIRATPLADSLRGWALIGVFLLDWLALYLLLTPHSSTPNPRRILIGLSGFALGGVLQPVLQPDSYFLIDSWKFGFGQPLTLLLLIIGCVWAGRNIYRHVMWALVLGWVGIFSIYKDFRSLGGVTLLTAFVSFLLPLVFSYARSKRLKAWNLAVTGLIMFAITWGILSGYTYAAQKGWLGDTSRVRSQIRSASIAKLIISGRSDFLPALYAIRDSPFLGYGSWARDPEYRSYLYDLVRLGYVDVSESARIDYLVTSSDIIPAHSHILQAWVWSGVLGVLFWVVVLVIIVRAIIKTITSPSRLFPLVVFVSILSIWNLLFSPFGSIMRLQWAYFLVIWLYVINSGRPSSQKSLSPQ